MESINCRASSADRTGGLPFFTTYLGPRTEAAGFIGCFEQQCYRASGLNLLTAAIVLCNTVYLQRATEALRTQEPVVEALLQYLSPLGWEHINLTGDYLWRSRSVPAQGRFRPIRLVPAA